MKRICVALAAVAALGLTSCGTAAQQSTGAGAAPGPVTVPGAEPLDAALVTPAFGWVLTAEQLLVSRDGGATLTPVAVPLPAGEARAAHFTDARTGAVAAAAGDTIMVASTRDAGQTWSTTKVTAPAVGPDGYSSLAMSFGDAAHGAIMARAATSAAFSLGTVLATTDGGLSWSANAAPEAGAIRAEADGRIWLAGAQLHWSTDQGRTWSASELALAGPVDAAAVAPPVDGTLPVTVLAGDRTEEQLLASPDGGRTWGEPTRVPVQGRTGPGVRLAVAGTAGGPVVYDTAGGHAYRRDGTDVRPAGLPDGVQAVTFAERGQHAWALAGSGTCGGGKQDCRYEHRLLLTVDGGLTWHPVALWTRAA